MNSAPVLSFEGQMISSKEILALFISLCHEIFLLIFLVRNISGTEMHLNGRCPLQMEGKPDVLARQTDATH